MSQLNKNIEVIFVWVRCNYHKEMTYIGTRDSEETGRGGDGTTTPTPDAPTTPQTDAILKLSELDIDDRYLEFMSGSCMDADEYMSAYMCSYAVDEIECIGMTRKHGLHERLNTIINRLNEMEKLLAAIARNTQAITIYKKTTTVTED